ncbi:MAG: restriction endonuclease subunit S [Flavobacteriales bacterium]|nr:restriction endonuclease subunit S [Flavobacteriales bacterium]
MSGRKGAKAEQDSRSAQGKPMYHPKLGHLPAHWKTMRFGDAFQEVKVAVDVEDAQNYVEIGIRSHGKGLFYKEPVTGAKLGDKSVFWVQPDCLVANIVFAWEQGIARTTGSEVGLIASHRFPMFKPKEDLVDLDFVLYFFKTDRGRVILDDASPGGAGRNKTLSRTELFRSHIPLPPLPEQRRIARILGTWDRAIGLLGQQIAAKEERLRGLIDQLVSGARHGASNGQLPKGWRWVRLGELGTFAKGKGILKSEIHPEGVPVVTYGELYTVHHVRVKRFHSFVAEAVADGSQPIQRNDVLFAGSGETAEEIGKAAVYLDKERACAGGDVIILRPNGINALYLATALNSTITDRQRLKFGQGHSVVHIYPSQLAEMEVPLPPNETQDHIANATASFDDELDLLRMKLKELHEQKRGLMQLLLSGGLMNH